MAGLQKLDDHVHIGDRAHLHLCRAPRGPQMLELEQIHVAGIFAEPLTEIGFHFRVFEEPSRVFRGVVGLALRRTPGRELPCGHAATQQQEEQDQPPKPALGPEDRIEAVDAAGTAAEARPADAAEPPIAGTDRRKIGDQGLPEVLGRLIAAVRVFLEAAHDDLIGFGRHRQR